MSAEIRRLLEEQIDILDAHADEWKAHPSPGHVWCAECSTWLHQSPHGDGCRTGLLQRVSGRLRAALTDLCDLPAPRQQEPPRWAVRYAIDRIVGAVAELPDRTSPDDWPDAMLVTADELRAIVGAEIGALLVPPSRQEEPSDQAYDDLMLHGNGAVTGETHGGTLPPQQEAPPAPPVLPDEEDLARVAPSVVAPERLDLQRSPHPDSSPHTPGPWRLWLAEAENDRGAFMLHGDSPEPHGSNMVITKRDIGTPNGAEGVANARLIAAAPTFYDALHSIANSSCCTGCQEAALVARRALGAVTGADSAVDPVGGIGTEGATLDTASSSSAPPVLALVETWRAGARQADRWAADSDAKHDGANSHAFRKERRIWTTCADELEAALKAAPPVEQERQEYGCINCGEARDGGYLSGFDGQINEGAVGPFCSQCWEFLRETFTASPPVEQERQEMASLAWFQSLLNVVIDHRRDKHERLDTVATELRRCLESLASPPVVSAPPQPEDTKDVVSRVDQSAQSQGQDLSRKPQPEGSQR